jgi:hypothetical protein
MTRLPLLAQLLTDDAQSLPAHTLAGTRHHQHYRRKFVKDWPSATRAGEIPEGAPGIQRLGRR